MVDNKIKVDSALFVQKGQGTLRDIYKIGQVLGEGAFGEVRLCTHRETKEKRAVKVLKKENMDKHEQQTMLNEINTLRSLDHPNIVKIFEYFEDEKRFYIVTEHIQGGELFDEIIAKGKFNERDASVLLKQLLSCVSYCHEHNIVHRDLKPENVLLEASKEFDQIKVIDFGLAKLYRDTRTHRHIPYRENKNLTGTARYASVNTHMGVEQARRDDLESLGYVLMYFLRGSLPWQGLKAETKNQKYERILERKLHTSIENLCKGFPAEFRSYFEHVRSLRFDDRPDYDYVKRLFRELFFRKGFSYDNVFDWEELNMTEQSRGQSAPGKSTDVVARPEVETAGEAETPSPGHGYQTRGAKKG